MREYGIMHGLGWGGGVRRREIYAVQEGPWNMRTVPRCMYIQVEREEGGGGTGGTELSEVWK
jgi:hypothetical protein